MPLPGKTLEDVEKEIFEQIRLVQEEPVTDAEIEKVVNQNAAALIRGMQSNMSLAQTLSTYEILYRWDYIHTYPGRIAEVTKEDVMRVAKKYLVEDHRTVIHLLPAGAGGR